MVTTVNKPMPLFDPAPVAVPSGDDQRRRRMQKVAAREERRFAERTGITVERVGYIVRVLHKDQEIATLARDDAKFLSEWIRQAGCIKPTKGVD